MKKDGTHRPQARRGRLQLATALTVASLAAPLARADVKWTAVDGDWNIGSNWSTGAVPGPKDAVLINSSAGVTPTAHLTTGNGTIASISVANGNRLSVETGGFLRTLGVGFEHDIKIGNAGTAGSFTMTGGKVTAGNRFIVSRGQNSSGTLDVSGGSIVATAAFVLASGDDDFAPSNATASATQTGGAISSLAFVSVALAGTATYNLSGGTLTAGNDFNVSDLPDSNGTLNLSGTGTAGGTTVYVSKFPGSTGVVNQTGGTMSVGDGGLVLGFASGDSGTYNLSGGLLDMHGSVIHAPKGAAKGTFNMTGGQIRNASAIEIALDQEGGTFSPGAVNGIGSASIQDYTLGELAELDIDIASSASFDQLIVQAGKSVNLRGRLSTHVGFKPELGQQFTVLSNQGTLSGNFSGLPEGATFISDDVEFRISYRGNAGSDVVLTVQAVPEPAAPLGLILAGLFTARRTRRRK